MTPLLLLRIARAFAAWASRSGGRRYLVMAEDQYARDTDSAFKLGVAWGKRPGAFAVLEGGRQ